MNVAVGLLCLGLNHHPDTRSVWGPQQNGEQWLEVSRRQIRRQHEEEFLNQICSRRILGGHSGW